jgi:hypothetical protein
MDCACALFAGSKLRYQKDGSGSYFSVPEVQQRSDQLVVLKRELLQLYALPQLPYSPKGLKHETIGNSPSSRNRAGSKNRSEREREREREREKPMAFQPSKIWIAMMGWLENMGTWNGYKRVVITVEHMKMHKLA